MSFSGCCTSKIKSPVRVLLYLLGTNEPPERIVVSHPISVYKYFHDGGKFQQSTAIMNVSMHFTKPMSL